MGQLPLPARYGWSTTAQFGSSGRFRGRENRLGDREQSKRRSYRCALRSMLFRHDRREASSALQSASLERRDSKPRFWLSSRGSRPPCGGSGGRRPTGGSSPVRRRSRSSTGGNAVPPRTIFRPLLWAHFLSPYSVPRSVRAPLVSRCRALRVSLSGSFESLRCEGS